MISCALMRRCPLCGAVRRRWQVYPITRIRSLASGCRLKTLSVRTIPILFIEVEPENMFYSEHTLKVAKQHRQM